MDESANNQYATARCRPEAEADNRVVAEGEDGYFSETTGLPVGLHLPYSPSPEYPAACRSTPDLSAGIVEDLSAGILAEIPS